MSYQRLNPKPQKTYTPSQAITVSSGYTLASGGGATKRNGMVALNFSITPTNAYTAGTEITIGTVINELKPQIPSFGQTWAMDNSQFYVDTNGAIKARLGHNVNAGVGLGWMRINYMAATY